MNIIEYWQQEVQKRDNYQQYDRKEFIQGLNENVPDWKAQVQDRSNWPHFHLQGNNLGELQYFSVIITEADRDFAFYMVEKSDRYVLESNFAMNCCVLAAKTDWEVYPDSVKDKLLEFKLEGLMPLFETHPDWWKALTAAQKHAVVDRALAQEPLYAADRMLYWVWTTQLHHQKIDGLAFATDAFRNVYHHIVERPTDRTRPDVEAQLLHSWNIPELVMSPGRRLRYEPSAKLSQLLRVTQSSADAQNTAAIQETISQLQFQYGR